MVDWDLSFRESEPLTVDRCTQAMSGIASGPLSTTVSTISGDPRDGYHRTVFIAAPFGDAHVQLALMQFMNSESPDDGSCGARLIDATTRGPIAAKLAAWECMRHAFIALGCRDNTLTWRPAPIVDEIEAAGDAAAAARLRREITAALVAEVRSTYGITLMSTRADVDAVLEACDAERVQMIVLTDCKLSGVPAGIGRFAQLEDLSITDDVIDGWAFRGLALPRLARLHIGGSGLRRLSREDLAGMPTLRELVVFGTPLEEIDAAIVEACPSLVRVQLGDTPFARDSEKLAALRQSWCSVNVD